MPVWVRHVVFKWMAPILRFKIPNKQKPSVVNKAHQDAVVSTANECTPNNKTNAGNVSRHRTSSLDTVFPRCNGVKPPLVRQLSYSNLVNGNYKSGPTILRQGDLVSNPRLTVTQAEDWCIASSIASFCSHEGRDQRHNSESCAGDETKINKDTHMVELLKMQETLLQHVQMLTNVVVENEQLQAKKYEWNLVASIFDQAFRIVFLLMFFLSTLTIFYFSKS